METQDNSIIVHKFGQDVTGIEIYSVCDLHIGDPKTDEKMIQNFVSFIAAKPNRYWVYNGDNINNAIKSSVSNVYNEKYPPGDQKYRFIELVRPIADKCLAFVPGNHEARSAKEDDVHLVFDIAVVLVGEARARELYRENEAFIKISLGQKIRGSCQNSKPATYVGLIHHGAGGGSLPGSSLNRIYAYTQTIEGLDFSMTGHVHKGILSGLVGKRVIDPRNNVVATTSYAIAISPSWADFGGYSARAMMRPAAHGIGWISLAGDRKCVGYHAMQSSYI